MVLPRVCLVNVTRRPTLSIIVCTQDRPEALRQCLRALREQDHADTEILVVDNAPLHHPAEEVSREFGVSYCLELRRGLAIARNTGASLAHGNLVAFTDDDAIPEPNWASDLVAEFSDETIAAVTGPVFPESGIPEDARRWVEAGGTGPGPELAETYDLSTPDVFSIVNSGGVGCGANMAFRREVLLDSIGGFDTRLGIGGVMRAGEEALAFWSLIKSGNRLRFTPRAIVRHPVPADTQKLRERYICGVIESACYFTLLFAEYPGELKNLLRLARLKLTGWQPSWRERFHDRGIRPIPRWRTWPYWVQGFLLYWKARIFAPESVSEPASKTELGNTSDKVYLKQGEKSRISPDSAP